MENLSNKDKKRIRYIHNLLELDSLYTKELVGPNGIYVAINKRLDGTKIRFKGFNPKYDLKDHIFLLSECKKLNYLTSYEERYEYRKEFLKRKLELERLMKLKPISEGRDNKDVRVGSGGGNRNTIRYPSKKRKTAWKRFYKLFPHLDPNKPKEDRKLITI